MANIRKNDRVIVITGKDKSKTGKVIKVIADAQNPDKTRLLIERINMVKKHLKPSAKNPQGGIVEREASIHISNVMLLDTKTGKGTRVGARIEKDKKVRYSKKSGETIVVAS